MCQFDTYHSNLSMKNYLYNLRCLLDGKAVVPTNYIYCFFVVANGIAHTHQMVDDSKYRPTPTHNPSPRKKALSVSLVET